VVELIKIKPFEPDLLLFSQRRNSFTETCRTERLTDPTHGSALFLPETSGLYSDQPSERMQRVRATSRAIQQLLDNSAGLAALFLVYGLVAIGLLAITMPPYQNPDEVSHFMRAEAISEGGVIGARFPTIGGGGIIDFGIERSAAIFEPLKFHPERKVTRAMAEKAMALQWGAEVGPRGFANTAIYSPVSYIPAVVGIWISKGLHLPVIRTLVISRLLMGLSGIAIATVAIALADCGAPFLFVILTLPMSLALMTSPSQDAMIMAFGALAAALLISAFQKSRLTWRAFIVLCTALAIIATARPPYAPIAVVPLLIPGRRLAGRITGVACVLGAVILWSIIAAKLTGVATPPGVEPTAQALRLLTHPAKIAPLVVDTFKFSGDLFMRGFIGQLGWLDVDMPHFYNVIALGALLLGTTLAALTLRGIHIAHSTRLTLALAILTSAAAIFAIQYLTWTKVGAPIIDGVQGRYFLPLATLSVGLLPSSGRPAVRTPGALRLAMIPVGLFPALTIIIVNHALIWRYYVS